MAAAPSATPPKGELVDFLARLIDAQKADIGHMVMAAGIDAAGNLDGHLARRVIQSRLVQPGRDRLGDGDGAGVGEIAVIKPRAGDDIAGAARIGRRQPRLIQQPANSVPSASSTCGRTRFCSLLTRISLRANRSARSAISVHLIGAGVTRRLAPGA
jgi:hypothetical protein